MMQKQYLTNIGVMYAIGVLLVLYWHSCPYIKWSDCGILGESIKIIYYFNMPLFFFLAGFMFEYTKSNTFNYKRYIFKKIRFLLIPYFFITSIAFIIKIFMNQYAIRHIDVSFNGFLHSLFYPVDNPNLFLWFFLVPVKIIFFEFLHMNYVVTFVFEFTISLFALLIVSTFLNKNEILKLLVGLK